jgi:thiopeptide-type bacteriocin biosynthesis protein
MQLTAGTAASDSRDPAALEANWMEDVRVLRQRLRDLLERPEIQQALYVASPSLLHGVEQWKRDPDSKKGLQAERAIVRYFARMCVRCTPFGVFSGCSVGEICLKDQPTTLILSPRQQYRTSSRLDFDYLFALSDQLRSDPVMKEQLRYYPNTSLRRIGGAWHYVECRHVESMRSHHLVKVEDDAYLRATLERASHGASVADMEQVVQRLKPEDGLTADDASEYVLELIEHQVLLSHIVPLVTGEQAVDNMIRELEVTRAGASISSALQRVQTQLRHLDARPLGSSFADYQAIARELDALPAKYDVARLYQVDMFKPVANAGLGRAVIDELARGVDVLTRLGRAEESPELTSFREAFSQRYDRALVPLFDALDEETGVGFGPSAAGTLPIPALPAAVHRSGHNEQDPTQAWLLRRLVKPAQALAKELVLDPSELPAARISSSGMARAFCIAATLVAPSLAAVNNGEFELHWKGIFGPSGARLLGRFCHGDAVLEELVRRHLRQEEALDPERVYAEVVHTPEGRVGNVLCRPLLRDYEIPYLGRSGAPHDRQLPISDLLVGVSGGRIVLYSQRLKREVVPRLSNAHGFAQAKHLAAYRFLCLLQNQQALTPGFWWGAPLNGLDFLPRVRVGRLVLAAARWRLSGRDIEELTKTSRHVAFAAVQAFRERRSMCRWMLFEESDNVLPLDLDNALSVDAFLHVLKRVRSAILTEMYPTPDQQCVTGPEGRYCHELNVPFIFAHAPEAAAVVGTGRVAAAARTSHVPALARNRPPGSEWLYAKVYTGGGIQDELLADVIPPIVEKAYASGVLRRWFFVRFGDPHDHLRIRFGGDPSGIRQEVLPLVCDAFERALSAGTVWKMEFDTYNREIERYGGVEGTIIAEDIFCCDSDAVLDLMRAAPPGDGTEERWPMALQGIDMFLSAFGLNLQSKRDLVSRWRDGFYSHARGRTTKRGVADRFRVERNRLERGFWGVAEADSSMAYVRRVLERRSRKLMAAAQQLELLAASGALVVDIPDLLSSYTHMHVNRLIRSAANRHEGVLYDFLVRLYDAKIGAERAAAGRRTGERGDLAGIP